MGNFGACKALGEGGITELRIYYGPGIRLYYSKIGNKIIFLLCGGDKGSQARDISKAKESLKDYLYRGDLPRSKKYQELLIEQLKDYDEEECQHLFLIVLRNVAKAHGGIGNLAKKLGWVRRVSIKLSRRKEILNGILL